jgi:hypothetical protein
MKTLKNNNYWSQPQLGQPWNNPWTYDNNSLLEMG